MKGSCRVNHNTYFTFRKLFSENRAVYEVIWNRVVEPDRSRMAV